MRTLTDIDRWRARAEEARTMADSYRMAGSQATLRKVAEDYEKMADDAEKVMMAAHGQRRPPVRR